MTIQGTIDTVLNIIANHAQQILPGMEPNTIRYGIAVALAATAIILLGMAVRALLGDRHSPQKTSRNTLPTTLYRKGMVVDLLNSENEEDVALRVVINSASSKKIKCEIVERLNVLKRKPGQKIRCMFPPVATENGKVNTFTAPLLESDTSGGKLDRVILGSPIQTANIPRRKYSRKRVSDQQFIRVKLWVDNPFVSDIAHEDARPHIGINSFSSEASAHCANTVVNISNGGLALQVSNRNIPETCAVGATVAINLFMFSFKEKTFKPYWYSGEVRSMEETSPGFTRMGLAFNGNGLPCEETGKVRWARF